MNQPLDKPKYEAYEVVTMFARYTGAWQEYSQRIAARHQIINIWMVGSTSLIVFFSRENLTTDLATATAIAMPILALAMFSMLLLHDLLMQRLSDYMRFCELHNNLGPSYSSNVPLPNYRDDPQFADGFIWTRSLQNFVLAAASCVLWAATLYIDEHRHSFSNNGSVSASASTAIALLPPWISPVLFLLWIAAILVNFSGIVYRSIRCHQRKGRIA